MASKAVSPVATLVFLDFEGTGLPSISCDPRATELCLIAIERNHFLTADHHHVAPRVTNKLTLCFNPIDAIPHHVVQLTGLSNEILKSQNAMNKNVGELLQLFIKHLTPPICFIAHGGTRFDFTLLNAEMKRIGCELPNDIFCADSFFAFKYLLKDAPYNCPLKHLRKGYTKVRYSLDSLYEVVVGKSRENHHNAESDAMALLTLCRGCSNEFCSWMDIHKERLEYISPNWKRKYSDED